MVVAGIHITGDDENICVCNFHAPEIARDEPLRKMAYCSTIKNDMSLYLSIEVNNEKADISGNELQKIYHV